MLNKAFVRFSARCALLAALALSGIVAFAASDAAIPDFQLTIQEGDTLSGLAQRWLAEPRRWPELQKHNKIENPNRLVPGSVLAIPAGLLREKFTELTVASVSGRAHKADGSALAVGDRLREGGSVKTAGDGYVTIKLADGSTLKLQAQSQLAIARARATPNSAATETQLQLNAGKAEVQFNPAKASGSRFEIRTGFASAAVRGTAFRVASDARGTRTEVTEGTIAFAGLPPDAGRAAPTDSVPVPEGYGSLVDESRKPIPPVRLLAAPALPQEPVFQRAPTLKFAFPALEGAVSYRALLAADAAFERIVGAADLTQPEINFSGLAIGSYVLKVRAVDKFGLEGSDAIALVGIVPGIATVPANSTAPAPAIPSAPSSPASSAPATGWGVPAKK